MSLWCNWLAQLSFCYLIEDQINTEPCSRNITSGGDDNGKSLTDNADGNSVGIERAARE